MADLRQRLDRGIAALSGEAVFTADDKHMPCNPGIDQLMREHGHGEPGGASDLHGVRIGRLNAKVLGEHGRKHDMRRNRRVTAENAVDLGPLQPGIGNRKLSRLAHEIERGRSLVLAIGCQPDAGDEAHDSTTSLTVIPGRIEDANPESRGSGFVAARRPGTTI
jgi:hypothetical protein